MRLALLLSLASLLACGSSHRVDDDPPLDLALPAPDGGGPEVDAFVRRPTSCTIEAVGESVGEPCFCNGLLAFREGYLYRQAIGIEVYRAEGGSLTLIGSVDERPNAFGGLAIVGDHLVSLLDFAGGDNLIVYSLRDPTRPEVVSGYRLPHDAHIDLAAHGDQLVVATQTADAAAITWLDLRDPGEPRERWTQPADGRPVAVALGDAGAFVIEDRGPADELEQWVRWMGEEGSVIDERRLTGRRWQRTLVVRGDELFVNGPNEPLIERFILGDVLTPADAIAGGDVSVGGDLFLRGDLAMMSNPLMVADVRAPMRELGRGASPIGDLHALAAPDGPLEWVYGSGGNGLVPLRVSCE